ncbi:hypothetical protein EMO90_11975, partial [Bifidobacterium vespertilionis]
THISPASKLQRGDIIVFKDPANWLGQEDTSGHNGYLIKRLTGYGCGRDTGCGA